MTERGRKRRKRERGKQVAALSLPLYSPAPKVDKQSDAAAMCIIFGARGLNHENSIKEMESRSQYTRLDKEDRR